MCVYVNSLKRHTAGLESGKGPLPVFPGFNVSVSFRFHTGFWTLESVLFLEVHPVSTPRVGFRSHPPCAFLDILGSAGAGGWGTRLESNSV